MLCRPLSGNNRGRRLSGTTHRRHQDQFRGKVSFWRSQRRRIPGQSKAGAVRPDRGLLASCRFCLEENREANASLYLWPKYALCSIRLQVEDYCPCDQISLCPYPGCCCWSRTLLCCGNVLFGFLPAGTYLLTLKRRSWTTSLLIHLSPGSNVRIRCFLQQCRYLWWRDPFHYFFNVLY